MKASCCAISAMAIASCAAYAIVIRHDVSDSRYKVAQGEFSALVDLPDEGHGVLIAPRWVITAAHAVQRQIKTVSINGEQHSVAEVIVHRGYKEAPRGLTSGDAARLMAFSESVDDIALINLDNPVKNVKPVPLYRGAGEAGKIVEILGKGATGNGLVGKYPNSPHRGELRRAYNRVLSADGRWIKLRFDAPPAAVDLEGLPTDGDSGAPVLVKTNGTWELAGLVSRKYIEGDISKFRPGLYGQVTYQVRISHYVGWIEGVVGKTPWPVLPARSTRPSNQTQ